MTRPERHETLTRPICRYGKLSTRDERVEFALMPLFNETVIELCKLEHLRHLSVVMPSDAYQVSGWRNEGTSEEGTLRGSTASATWSP